MSHKLTKAEIIDAAQQNIGRGSELDAICDVRVNLILDEIFEAYINEVQLKTDSTISFSNASKTWTVPTDYIKGKFLKYIDTDANADQPPNVEIPIISYEEYQSFRVPDATGSPKFVCATRTLDATGEIVLSGFVYPKTDKAYTCTLIYYFQPGFDTADAESVRFFNTSTVVDLLTNYLRGMGYDTIGAQPYDPGLLEKIIGRARRNMADMGIYPSIAKLDRRVFRPQENILSGRRFSRILR